MAGQKRCPALLVGHYCHDCITLPGGEEVHALGGSVAYISNVFDALGVRAEVVSKVGSDFLYGKRVTHAPQKIGGKFTTEFFADLSTGEERVLKSGHICEPIYARDISPDVKYELGLAVGVAGEILPETLERMVECSHYVVVDVQALIRTIDPVTRIVGLCRLDQTPFHNLLHHISFLKATHIEASYIDVEQVRQHTCVIVTEGKYGCKLYTKDNVYHFAPFPAIEVDPTGAGDSFLAGFSAGIIRGLTVERSALMGNYFGALAVGQVGVPHFSSRDLQGLSVGRPAGTTLNQVDIIVTAAASIQSSTIVMAQIKEVAKSKR